MQIKVGEIVGTCPRCEKSEFVTAGSNLACADCGHETSRTEVLVRINRDLAERLRGLRQGANERKTESALTSAKAIPMILRTRRLIRQARRQLHELRNKPK